MASYFHKIETNENGSKDQRQKVERERVKDNAFVGGSVKIDLIDDTALLNVVPFCKKKKVKIVLRDLELHTMIRKLWSDMYARLLPEMVTEYRGLVSLTNPKTSEFQSEGEWHRRGGINYYGGGGGGNGGGYGAPSGVYGRKTPSA
ncbi:hypothetical protein Bca4012_002487 [Brassica carinata]|uniref:Uncharacterized protein n=1 Tax=Brassica carinata TaxID=52824 RepID=A0A8X7S271_BRACI|nr:hypothetical protein Bca52824_042748 [Brassica carinata]